MDSFISTAVFAVLFCASGVVGQTGGTGQVCISRNTCIATSTDVCGVNSICRRKVDATCASPNQNQCVIGAQCNGTTATCQCKTPAYVVGSTDTDLGRCVPSPNFVGGTCSAAGTDRGTCWDTNSACTIGVCTCKAGYVRNTDGNTCVLGPSGGIGQVCNTALTCNTSTTDVCGVNNICRRKVDATCASPNQNLCVLGAQCDVSTTTCKCKTPTYMVGSGIEVGRCVPSPSYVGGTCSGFDRGTCQDASAVCVGGLCTCKTSYVRNSDTNSCVLAQTGGTGQACSSGNTCSATTTDVCGVNSICRRKVEAACGIPYTHLCVLGAQCDSATITCKCKAPAYVVGSGTDAGRCVPSPTYVGGTCSGLDRGTCLDASALCTNGICACRTGYARNTDGNTCMLGQPGTTGQACNFGSTPCNANTTDVCENNICKRRADATCVDPNQNQCVLGAQCDGTTTTCRCRTPYFYAGASGIDLGKCLPSPNYVGGACTGPGRGSCTDPNALCTNGACQCKTSYVRNNDTYTCYVVTGGTGQTCNPGSICNATATDVCENTYCKRRLGANCAYPNDKQCVLGAQCDSRTQTCACWTPYYTTGTSFNMGKCVPAQNYVGGACAGTDKGTCLDTNAVCSAGICTCKTNYVRNIDYNACNGANGQTGGTGQLCTFGNTCNATTTDVCENTVCKRRAGASCASPYQDQCVLGAQCDANFCRCKTPQYTVGTSGANLGKCAAADVVTTAQPTRHHDVTCLDTRMSFSIPFPGNLPRTAILSDPRCHVDTAGGNLMGSINLNSCGTTVAFTNDSVIFRNVITVTSADNSTGEEGLIPIQCKYDRFATVQLGYMPVVRHVLFTEVGIGQLSFRIQQFMDARYLTAVADSQYPLRMEPNARVYIQLSLGDVLSAGHKDDIGINVQQCVASPFSTLLQAQSNSVPLIQESCPASNDVQLVTIYPEDIQRVRFSFKVVSFPDLQNQPGDFGLVFVHCRVSVCPADECSASNRTCPDPSAIRRVRRSAHDSVSTHQLSTGPFLVSEDKGGAVSSTTALAAVSMVVAAIATVVAMVAVVAWRRSRRDAIGQKC